jgi:hypothetical protein
VGLLKPDVRDLSAVAGVPAKRGPPEPPRLVDQEEDELERVREAHKVKLGSGGECDRRVAAIQRAAEAAVGRALGGHEQMFAQPCSAGLAFHVLRLAMTVGPTP